MKERFYRIKELTKHKIAFAKTEKRVLGINTFRSITHDLDKLLMYFTPLKTEYIRKRHKEKAKHHNRKTEKDYLEAVIDFECARFTKRNSPLTAREFINKKFDRTSQEYYIFIAICNVFKLK